MSRKGHEGIFWHPENALNLVNTSILSRIRHVWPEEARLMGEVEGWVYLGVLEEKITLIFCPAYTGHNVKLISN